MKRNVFLTIILGVSFMACGGDLNSEGLLSAAPVPARPAPPPPPAAPVKGNVGEKFKALQPFFFAYRDSPVETQTNVFRSNLAAFTPAVEIEDEVAEEEQAPLTPLQIYDTESYKLVLIMSGTATPKAQVIDPQGKAYIVKVGDPIGNRNGKVVSISGAEVRIEEPGFPPIAMSLQSSEEEMLQELRAVQEF